MTNIIEWSADKEDWQKDALRRIAISDSLSSDDKTDIQNRVQSFCGIQTDIDFECLPLTDGHIAASVAESNPLLAFADQDITLLQDGCGTLQCRQPESNEILAIQANRPSGKISQTYK